MVQVCTIDMIVGTLDLKTVTLSPDMMWLEQYKDMTLFQITHHELRHTNASNPDQGLRMLIVMKRKIMSEIMTTFFPSILLTLITFATTFFKQIHFEASLSVNLTTMLVLTTIFISKMEGLPSTSETKMIDMWLILCQLVPFVEVILVTAIEFYDVEKSETASNDSGMGTVLADLYSRKNRKDMTTMEKQIPQMNNYVAEEQSGKKANLCIIVAHLPFIGKKAFKRKGILSLTFSSIPEQKVVPGAVVLLALAYFAVAASYYYD